MRLIGYVIRWDNSEYHPYTEGYLKVGFNAPRLSEISTYRGYSLGSLNNAFVIPHLNIAESLRTQLIEIYPNQPPNDIVIEEVEVIEL